MVSRITLLCLSYKLQCETAGRTSNDCAKSWQACASARQAKNEGSTCYDIIAGASGSTCLSIMGMQLRQIQAHKPSSEKAMAAPSVDVMYETEWQAHAPCQLDVLAAVPGKAAARQCTVEFGAQNVRAVLSSSARPGLAAEWKSHPSLLPSKEAAVLNLSPGMAQHIGPDMAAPIVRAVTSGMEALLHAT